MGVDNNLFVNFRDSGLKFENRMIFIFTYNDELIHLGVTTCKRYYHINPNKLPRGVRRVLSSVKCSKSTTAKIAVINSV